MRGKTTWLSTTPNIHKELFISSHLHLQFSLEAAILGFHNVNLLHPTMTRDKYRAGKAWQCHYFGNASYLKFYLTSRCFMFIMLNQSFALLIYNNACRFREGAVTLGTINKNRGFRFSCSLNPAIMICKHAPVTSSFKEHENMRNSPNPYS